MRINHTTFNFIFDGICEDLILTPTNLKPNQTSPGRQLALTIYRLATGCTYSTISDLFGVSVCVSAASKFFNKICWLMFVSLYDRQARLSTADEEWQIEILVFSRELRVPLCRRLETVHRGNHSRLY